MIFFFYDATMLCPTRLS